MKKTNAERKAEKSERAVSLTAKINETLAERGCAPEPDSPILVAIDKHCPAGWMALAVSYDKDGKPTGATPKGWDQHGMARAYAEVKRVEYEPEEARLYRYVGTTGAWERIEPDRIVGELGDWLRGEVMAVAGEEHYRDSILGLTQPTHLKGIKESLTGVAPFMPVTFVQRRGERPYVHFRNTMLEWTGGKWAKRPFSPDYYSIAPLAFDYDPKAKCPRFMREVVERRIHPDDREAVQMLFGLALRGLNEAQSIFIFTGQGGRNKSTLLNVLRSLLDNRNVSQLRVGQLNYRHLMANCKNSLALIAPDLTFHDMREPLMLMLKSLTGDDLNEGDVKQVQKTVKNTHAYLVLIATNDAPCIPNAYRDVDSWTRRLYLVPMQGEAIAPEKQQSRWVHRLLAEEAPGIANWALEGYRKFKAKGLRRSPRQLGVIANAIKDSDERSLMRAALVNVAEPANGEFIATEALVAAVVEELGSRPVASRLVGERCKGPQTKALLDTATEVHLVQRTTRRKNGKPVRGLAGLRLKPRSSDSVKPPFSVVR